MTEPKWLSPEDVIFLQAIAIEKDGGLSGGLTRPDLLESALARPRNEFAYTGQDDVFMLAATYAEGVAKNHAFADANKRTAFLSAAAFLRENGKELLPAKGSEHADMMVQLETGEISREEMGVYLSDNAREIVPEQALEAPEIDDLLKDYDEQPAQDEHENSRDHDMADDD